MSRPDNWIRIEEDRRRGGLIYFYRDGSEYHMTKEELSRVIWPQPEDGEGSSVQSAVEDQG